MHYRHKLATNQSNKVTYVPKTCENHVILKKKKYMYF
jgi:hypothetical protein